MVLRGDFDYYKLAELAKTMGSTHVNIQGRQQAKEPSQLREGYANSRVAVEGRTPEKYRS